MKTVDLVIIGGTGFYQLDGLDLERQEPVETPFGMTQAPLAAGTLRGRGVAFLPRHGPGHEIAPHQVNYRANVWACSSLSPRHVVSINAVGSLNWDMPPRSVVLPDQLIDYTWGREHSFVGALPLSEMYVDMTEPYCSELRRKILQAGQGILSAKSGVLGVAQGPRLETAAEINRLAHDGCDLVGMTGMPEAGLARELELSYASICIVANRAAGLDGQQAISMDQIFSNISQGAARVLSIIERLLDHMD